MLLRKGVGATVTVAAAAATTGAGTRVGARGGGGGGGIRRWDKAGDGGTTVGRAGTARTGVEADEPRP